MAARPSISFSSKALLLALSRHRLYNAKRETQQVGRLHSSPLQLYKWEVVQYGLLRVHFNHCSRHWLNDCHKKELTAHVYQTKRLAYQPWRGDALRCLSFILYPHLSRFVPFFQVLNADSEKWQRSILHIRLFIIKKSTQHHILNTPAMFKTMVGTTRFELAASSTPINPKD